MPLYFKCCEFVLSGLEVKRTEVKVAAMIKWQSFLNDGAQEGRTDRIRADAKP